MPTPPLSTSPSALPPLGRVPTHRGRRIGAGIGVAVLLLLIALVLFPGSWMRAIINDKGSSKMGREFAIDGPMTLRWNHGLVIDAQKIHMANEQGLQPANMVEIGDLTIVMNPWKLLEGQMNLPALRIKDMRVVLEKRTPDDANWKLPMMSQGKAVTNAALPQKRSNFPVIGELKIENGIVEYKDDQKQQDVTLNVSTVMGGDGDAKGQDGMKVSGHGTLQDKTFDLEATGGSINMLRDTSKPWPLNLKVTMGATQIAVDGTFTDPVQMEGVNAHLSLEGDNLADLFYLTAIPLPPSPSYSIDGQLVKKGDVWAFNDFKGAVGRSDLEGNLKYDTSGKRGVVGATLTSQRLDVADLRGFAGAPPPKSEAQTAEQKAKAAQQAGSANLIPDVPIKLNRLRATDMDVSLHAAQVLAPGWPLEDMDVHFNLKDGLLRIDPLRFGLADGEVSGTVVLDGRNDEPAMRMDIVLKRLSLPKFLKDSRFASFSKGTFGGHFDLAGHGDSLANVAGDSNGHVTVLMAGGEISKLIVKAAGLDVANAATLFATKKDEPTPIRCGIGDFAVRDGVLTSDIFVFDTGDTSFTGGATINLRDQTIDAGIEASPKSPSLLAADTPITIKGMLKKPSIGIDPKEAGARVGAAAVLGVLLTPIASVIPFIELGLGKDSDCRGLIAQAQSRDAQRKTTMSAAPSEARTGQAPVTTAPQK